MKICIVGTGYVGLVTGACLADWGNTVVCVDINKEKIERLNQGILPIYEPELGAVVDRNKRNGNLSFSMDIASAISSSAVVVNAVGTPLGKDGEADLGAVESVARDFGRYAKGYALFVNKSTIPMGKSEYLKSLIQDEYDQRELSLREGLVFDVVNNPEFLREGSAVKDFTDPDRVIVGVESDQAGEIMRKLYEPLIERGISYMETSCSNAEAIKYASNAFLATKISFVNEMAMLCEKYGANIEEVALGMGMDPRIAPAFLKAGIGYGGSCLPKDVAQLIVSGQSQGVDMLLLKAVNEINQAQSDRFIDRLKEVYPDLSGLTVAVWGLTFKPETDDIREAAAFRIIPKLLKKGVTVQVFDPEGMENAKAQLGESVVYAKTPYKALEAADGLLILTEWDVFRNADLVEVKKHLKKAVVIDGRNLYDLNEMESMEFIYRSIGRTLKSIN